MIEAGMTTRDATTKEEITTGVVEILVAAVMDPITTEVTGERMMTVAGGTRHRMK